MRYFLTNTDAFLTTETGPVTVDWQKAYLEVLESQLHDLVKAIESVSKHRSGLSISDFHPCD